MGEEAKLLNCWEKREMCELLNQSEQKNDVKTKKLHSH